MNQRQLQPDSKIIPAIHPADREQTPDSQPEDLIFDKAEKASELETLRKQLEKLKNASAETQGISQASPETVKQKIIAAENRIEELDREIKTHTEKNTDD